MNQQKPGMHLPSLAPSLQDWQDLLTGLVAARLKRGLQRTSADLMAPGISLQAGGPNKCTKRPGQHHPPAHDLMERTAERKPCNRITRPSVQ